MKNIIQRNKQNRKLAFQFENIRLILKSIIKNKFFFSTIRWNAILKLENLPKNSSKSKFNKRCILTNRKKGMVSKFKLSRLAFLKMSRLGQISGIKKSVW